VIELSRYALETLRKDEEFILYRGRSQGDACQILVLSPVAEHPTPESVRRLEHECSFREALDPAWSARPIAMARHSDRTVLQLEDPGGVPLDQLLGDPLDLAPLLRLAVGLSAAIDHLHERGIIHKDIKPANVLVDPVTGQCWLRGFGIASRLPRERQSLEPPEFVAGTLAYMAPEQTGRINRSIDSRSDLYSLGVTLYEMLTGALPFMAADPMDWVHCHIARQPVPPGERSKNVPPTLSAIIMKLLAKTAEERYQTAVGVQRDLRRCLAQWETQSRIDEFPLGEHDTPDRLLIPEKLYGRAREIDTLLASFERVVASGTPELVLVSGYSGIGKSSVVNELHKMLVLPRGLFASGKFDQYKRDIPYSTLAQAFQGVIRPLLGKSDVELSHWREALQEALGPNGQLMVDLVPELALILGRQTPLPELSPQDAQRRFQLVLRRFIGVFARPEHPLALFLDDLQWLDAATLDLIEDLLRQPDVQHLLLIGAYRDNEVNANHPLMRKLEAVRRAGALVQEITLAPLAHEDLKELIADSLRCAPERAAPLALLVHEKTGGNPFFAIQFISALAEEGLLTFDHGMARWSWDLARIHAKGYTDNVVDLMVGKLNRLPVETQQTLKEFAGLGNSAEITTLSIVRGTSAEEVHSNLWEALRLGYIVRLDGSYKFVHDRVQEAAYSLIPEELRAEAHLRMGRQLYSSMTRDEITENIFSVVNQLNAGAALITERTEKERVAELNLAAGQKTKASAAYALARNYFALGMAMVGRISWKRRYDLALSLWLERAECEFLTGNIETAERLISEVLQKAKSKLDKAAAYRLRVELCVMKTQNAQAVEIALECLRLFGIEMAPHPTPQQVQNEYEEVWKNLKGLSIASLIGLPRMSDPEMQAAMSVLSSLSAPAMNTDSNLFRLLICHMVNVSVKYGITAASTHGYAWFGVVLGPVFHRYEDAYRFGKLAVDLVEKYDFLGWKAKVYYAMETVLLWTQPLNTAIDFVKAAFLAGLETGDLTFACYSSHHLVNDLLLRGEHLDQVWLESAKAHDFARNAKFRDVADAILSIQRFVQNIRGQNGGSSTGAEDERGFEARLHESPMPTKLCWYWILRLWGHFMAGDYAAAIAAGQKARELLWASEGHIQLLDYCYYTALSAAAFWKEAPPDKQSELLDLLIQQLAQLKEWAQNCPSTFRDKYALAAAELARIEGRELDAEGLYEQAIRSARANGFVHNEALANELAARFYATRGFEKIANVYLRDARYGYVRWGADGKVRQLDELYPHLRAEEPLSGQAGTIGAPVEQLDLATVLKVSLAVSGEIVPEKLIETVLKLALEHAGAERGLLILPHGEQHRIEAEIKTDLDQVQVQLRHAPITSFELPESLFRYVIRTQQKIILDDASTHNMFSEDDYLRQRCPRSILCLPLVKQTKVVGALYLEHNLAPRVFTQKRLAMLEMLASQAAISLDHARLYSELSRANANLEHEISERLRAETAARRSEAYLAEAESLSKCGSWALKPATKEITYWSPQRYHLFGFDPDAGVPSYEAVLERVHPEDRARWLGNTEEAGRRDSGLEFRVVLPDGEIKQLQGAGHPVFSESGELVEIIGAAIDVTKRKRAEEQQREAQTQLAHVTRVTTLGEMTASIAHEINQPLAGIATNANASLRWLARDSPNLAEAREAISRIIRDTNRASDVISRIRALFKKAPTATETVNINEVIEEVLTLTQAELQRNRVSSRIQFANDLPMVIGDKIQLQQVILNLVVNAIEAMSGVAGGARELCVSSQKVAEIPAEKHAVEANTVSESAFVLIAVCDSGPGLDATQLTRVFEPFYTTKSQGTGMGLAISRSIIEAHHGRLWVTANAPQGAVFQFTLPCIPA
jgi:PAS domain S-box-containing protein